MHVTSDIPTQGSGLMTTERQSSSLSIRSVFAVNNESSLIQIETMKSQD